MNLQKMKALMGRASVAAAGLVASSAALAANTSPGTGAIGVDAFEGYSNTVRGWASGGLGTGLSITMMLIGAGMGIARNSPMPALSGIAGAAFLNWGPQIIDALFKGALI